MEGKTNEENSHGKWQGNERAPEEEFSLSRAVVLTRWSGLTEK
jgi:hypothetical protein